MIKNLLLTLRRWVEYAVYTILVAMTVIICWQVISRFFFGVTPEWSQELSLLLLVWSSFIGIALGIQDDSHIQIGLFIKMFPDSFQFVLNKLNRLLAIAFGFFMLLEGGKFAKEMSSSSIAGLGIPSTVLYLSVPIAGALVILYLLAEFLGQWVPQVEEEKGVEE